MENFLRKDEEERVIQTIRAAERQSSGEIRVHLHGGSSVDDVMEAAKKAFHRLGMDKTKDRNGVLVFIAPHARRFAILGDEGIDAVVPVHFWEEERDILQAHFKSEQYADGICKVIEQIGAKLKAYFPYQADDVNELPDDISYD